MDTLNQFMKHVVKNRTTVSRKELRIYRDVANRGTYFPTSVCRKAIKELIAMDILVSTASIGFTA